MNEMIENLEIRKAQPEDVAEAIPLIYCSGPEEFEYGFTHGEESAQAFLAYGFQSTKGLFSFRNHYVAKLGNEIVGIGAFYSDAEYSACSTQLLFQILKFYPIRSWFGIICHALHLQTVIPPLPHNTFYVANLGVKTPYRGQGIGKALINFGKNIALNRHIPAYTLDVSTANPRGQALYEREGFSVVREYQFKGQQKVISGSRRMRMLLAK